jgi:UDP-2-acetamido-3-amino-2,3-dideoxy-glucuronate N-acetyltransferase
MRQRAKPGARSRQAAAAAARDVPARDDRPGGARRATGRRPADVFVHPQALCESDDVGPRTRVWAFAHVMRAARIGSDCNVGDHAFIESGARIGDRVTIKNHVLVWDKVTIEDEVFVGPNAVFTNDLRPRVAFKNPPERFLPTLVRRGASIGANATIVCGVTIGSNALIGAGSVVTRSVPAHALIVGNPGRRIGWICACTQTLRRDLSCACGRRYRLVDTRAGLVPMQTPPRRGTATRASVAATPGRHRRA